MDDKLYNLMNWREIEGITYSDTDRPGELLGQHVVKDGVLIQAFVPGAVSLQVKNLDTNRSKEMKLADEAGYFAILLSGKKKIHYKLVAVYEDKSKREFYDAYAYDPMIPQEVLEQFNAGIAYDIYQYLGAHKRTVDGVEGTNFAVWAPFATRVSVVGEFNQWDGRIHQMSRRGDSGVFEIFIPETEEGMFYKYEVRRRGDLTSLKYDPYAFQMEQLPGKASVVSDIKAYKWTDQKWLDKRAASDIQEQPMNIYEVALNSYAQPEDLVNYVSDMGYTHVKLLGILGDEKFPRNYYAPNPASAQPKELMAMIDQLHNKNIGVIIDIPMQHFSSEEEGMAVYDGSCLYEHDNMKQGYHPKYNTKLFNYGRPEVSNFLISAALFWTQVYHVDGINITCAAGMLYLDYDKKNGEWIPNIYGGNENLEALELFRHMNSIYQKLSGGGMLIAQDNSGYQNMTGAEVTSECFGFDFKYNYGWRNDLLDYMKNDPFVRDRYYHELTLNNIYTFHDNFILPLSSDLSNNGQPSLFGRMVGISEEKKYANLKLAISYYMTYPGKKMLYMGNDMASYRGYDADSNFDTAELQEAKNENINACVKALNQMYMAEPALYELDGSEEGFEWINNISAQECILVYARKGKNEDDLLVIVCNFDDVEREEYKIGVPKAGKYKEIFNSDNEKFGGNGFTNPRLKQSKTDECDGREESVRIKVPALGVTVLKYSKADKAIVDNKTAKTEKTATSKKAVEQKEDDAPKKAVEQKEDDVPKKAVEQKEAAAPKKATVSKKAAAPKKATTSKKAAASKKATASKKTDAPKEATASKKTAAPKQAEEQNKGEN